MIPYRNADFLRSSDWNAGSNLVLLWSTWGGAYKVTASITYSMGGMNKDGYAVTIVLVHSIMVLNTVNPA